MKSSRTSPIDTLIQSSDAVKTLSLWCGTWHRSLLPKLFSSFLAHFAGSCHECQIVARGGPELKTMHAQTSSAANWRACEARGGYVTSTATAVMALFQFIFNLPPPRLHPILFFPVEISCNWWCATWLSTLFFSLGHRSDFWVKPPGGILLVFSLNASK